MKTELSSLERRKYAKQLANKNIGEEGQLKLSNISVLVIGAGGLGVPVLQYLASMGVGTLGIMDNDLIFEKNLPGQVLYSIKDLGKHKTIVAKQKLEEINSSVEYHIHNICLTSQNAIGFIQRYDIIIDATNDLETKYVINDACVILNKKWIFTCSDGFEAIYSVFDGKSGPTLKCLIDQDKSLEDKIDYASELGIAAGIAGTLAAAEVIKMAVGHKSNVLGNLVRHDLYSNSTTETEVTPVSENLEKKSM